MNILKGNVLNAKDKTQLVLKEMCRSKGKIAAAKIPAQFLLLRGRNKKQWAKDHFERFGNDKYSHNNSFTMKRTTGKGK